MPILGDTQTTRKKFIWPYLELNILHKNSFHGFLLKQKPFLLPQISFVIRTSILCLKLVHFIREHMQDSKLEQIPGGAAHLKTIHMYKKMANQVGYTEGGGGTNFPIT